MNQEVAIQAKPHDRRKVAGLALVVVVCLFAAWGKGAETGYLPGRDEGFGLHDSIEDLAAHLQAKVVPDHQRGIAKWRLCSNDGTVADGRDFLVVSYGNTISQQNFLVRETPAGWRLKARHNDRYSPKANWPCRVIVPTPGTAQ